MTEISFDTNILIDLLSGDHRARDEVRRASRPWISRISWIEVMSKVRPTDDPIMRSFFADFGIDEVDEPVGRLAAALRLDRHRLKLPDALILASAQINRRLLVTRNTKDFPADMPGIRVPYQF